MFIIFVLAEISTESLFLNCTVCLDGSPPAYAYVEGYGNGSTNWIVLMEVIN